MRRSIRWPESAVAGRKGGGAGRGVAKRVPQPRGANRSQPKPLERDILRGCLAYLNAHPKVAFVFRANTGLVSTPDGRRFKAGFKGCSDILGMLKGGKFLAVECKREGQQATEDQYAFLNRVMDNGGLAFVARCIEDCHDALGANPYTHPAA